VSRTIRRQTGSSTAKQNGSAAMSRRPSSASSPGCAGAPRSEDRRAVVELEQRQPAARSQYAGEIAEHALEVAVREIHQRLPGAECVERGLREIERRQVALRAARGLAIRRP
jgi:hypothetical protein